MNPWEQRIAAARQLLANMPDEVFEIYIKPLIVSDGWPFQTVDEPTVWPWFGYFDSHTIKQISQLTWERKKLLFGITRFHPDAINRIHWIIGAHIHGHRTPCSGIAAGRQRFLRCRRYIAQRGSMPSPVILMHNLMGYRVLDGNHRLAALASLRGSTNVMVDCWIGTPPRTVSR